MDAAPETVSAGSEAVPVRTEAADAGAEPSTVAWVVALIGVALRAEGLRAIVPEGAAELARLLTKLASAWPRD